MDNQRIREITQHAIKDAAEVLKRYFNDQNLSQEEKASIFDTLEAGVPFYPAELKITTNEEKNYYDRSYMKTIHKMKSGILDHGKTVDEAINEFEKFQNIEMLAAKTARDILSSLKPDDLDKSLSSILDNYSTPENSEKDIIFSNILQSLLLKQLTTVINEKAKQAVEIDIQNKNTAEYDRRVQMESGVLLKNFKDQYAAVAKEKAEQKAMEDAEAAAKIDYEAGNEDHKEPQLLDSMSDVYRSAYVSKYSKAYKLEINRLKPHGPEAEPDNELERLRQLQEENEKRGKKKSKAAKEKNKAQRLKVNKFGVKLLNKIGIWGQKQLNDVEDVIKEFGSVRAVHNPYRENYYSKEERERCEKILMAYERLQELLELSPARNRDGSKPYVSIKGMLTIAGLTEEQKKDLEALEGKVTSAYLRTAHSAKDSTELDAIVKEADELFERITKELKEEKDKKAQKPEKDDKNEVMKKEDIKIPSIISQVEMLLKDAKEKGVLDVFYALPGLKLTYDIEMKKEPLMRENYERAMDAAQKMERIYELEKGLVKSAVIKKNKANKTKPTPNQSKKNPAPAPNQSKKPKNVEPLSNQDELLRQLHEAQQDASKWKEKYEKTRETLGKRNKSLKSAKNAKKRLAKENAQLTESIELLTRNVKELQSQMQKMTSDLSVLRDAAAKEERQKDQYKKMLDEVREAMQHQSSVEMNSDEKDVEELVSYMNRLDQERFFQSDASKEVLNELYMLKAKGTLRPEYAEKLNKVIRQIEKGRNVPKDQQLDIPFQKHI